MIVNHFNDDLMVTHSAQELPRSHKALYVSMPVPSLSSGVGACNNIVEVSSNEQTYFNGYEMAE